MSRGGLELPLERRGKWLTACDVLQQCADRARAAEVEHGSDDGGALSVGEPRFARVHLLEWQALGTRRDAALRRFAGRYGRSFARSGRAVPPPEALFVLAAGIDQLVRARLRDGADVTDLEDTLVGCTLRLAGEEEPWT